jgi:hypothetical protein
MAEQPDASDAHEHDDHCVCDIDLKADEITSDMDLPVAAGGVAPAGGPQADDDVDGCDEDFNKFEPTSDEDLPVAIGGVA